MNKMRNKDRTELTPREIEALYLQKQGLSHEQIARKLGLSRGTIKAHILSANVRIRAKERTWKSR